MFDLYGPVNGTGPVTVTVTNHVPLEQIERLIRAIEGLNETMGRVSNEIVELEKELGELTTVVEGTGTILDRIATAVEQNIGDETKLRALVASIRSEKEKIIAQNVKGTAAAEELEKEDETTPPG